MKILLNEYKNKESVNEDIEIKECFLRHSKLIQNENFEKVVDEQEVYTNERDSCNNYNLNITIEPYCTNILFNPSTEVVSGETLLHTKEEKYDSILNATNGNSTFKPGYDMFNNHVFRRRIFKTGETIKDYSIDDVNTFQNTINNYLVENEGWIGFPNPTQIGGNPLFNDKKPCEHIDMYPDRSLFTFKPQYRNEKIENNWKYCITYANREINDHPLVGSYVGQTLKNGIKITKYEIDPGFVTETNTINNNSVNYLYIKTEYNHGLKVGDQVEIDGLSDNSGNNVFEVYKLGGSDDFKEKNNNFVIKSDFSNYKTPLERIYYDVNLSFNVNYSEGGTITESGVYKAGSEVNFSITPNDGYILNGFDYSGKFYYITGTYGDLTIEGTELDGINVKINSLVRGNSGNTTNITGYFRKEKYTLNLSLNTNDNCFVTPSIGETLTGGTFVFDYNTSVNLISWTDYVNYYNFSGWYENWTGDKNTSTLLSTEKILKISMTNNFDIVGIFERIEESTNTGTTKNTTSQYVVNTSQNGQPAYGLTQTSVNSYFIGDLYNVPIINQRMRKIKSNVPYQYYIRVFKKIQNEDIKIEYPLAFSRTIYNDQITQIGYFNDVKLDGYYDNKNRPLTEIFFTIVKNNKNGEESEIFTQVTSGINGDKSMNDYNIRKINYNSSLLNIENNITINNNEFYGDIVEYNPIEVKEVVLENIMHRFNTKQREYYSNNLEIWYTKFPTDKNISKISGRPRNEGYFYKPHYNIDVKGLSKSLKQSGLSEILTCPDEIIIGSDFIQLTTQKKQNLQVNDLLKIYLYDESYSLLSSQFVVVKNINEKHLTVSKPLNFSDSSYMKVRVIPYNTPHYFQDLNDGRVLWRDIIGTWDANNYKNSKELQFSNNRLYVNKSFKFFMRRQDPFGEFGLLYSNFPNDIIGTKINEYDYNIETNEVNNLC